MADIPNAILECMSPGEVERVIAEMRAEADALENWNNDRPSFTPQPGFFDSVPPPKSLAEYNWRGKAR